MESWADAMQNQVTLRDEVLGARCLLPRNEELRNRIWLRIDNCWVSTFKDSKIVLKLWDKSTLESMKI
ncbi:hypothetical protein L5515_019570 [Caenorhabditis briggsae]|uniref:Uncharacterized protein n=1 Tax=Caenorhabditis briggsae TaxID=6238 RepID=A0AAE9FIP1_CAEBR|nr:hypothetical protein L5515_019570 [Caenorhabditis briggsae]